MFTGPAGSGLGAGGLLPSDGFHEKAPLIKVFLPLQLSIVNEPARQASIRTRSRLIVMAAVHTGVRRCRVLQSRLRHPS